MTWYFDMDGTIVDFYGVENWLRDLTNEVTRPYAIAKPLVNLARLARLLNGRQKRGDKICIISWGSKGASDEYLARIAKAKESWLERHMPSVHWDSIQVVPYGTSKISVAEDKDGWLFDDEEQNRIEWGDGFKETEIFEVLTMMNRFQKKR